MRHIGSMSCPVGDKDLIKLKIQVHMPHAIYSSVE